MIFLLDANIPPSLADDFSNHDVIHVSTLPNGSSTSDREVMEFCLQNNCVLISKDSDFYDSFILSKKPPKLILVKLGNVRLRELRDYFRKNLKFIEALLDDHSVIILTTKSIKTL